MLKLFQEWLRQHLCPKRCGPVVDPEEHSSKFTYYHVCAINDGESSKFQIRRGDILRVPLSATGLTLPAENIFTKCRGYVNTSDITDKHEESFILAAWRDIDRDKAVSLLSQPEIESGNFILCSGSANSGLALMIRTDNKPFVKVYEIHPNKSNQYCIQERFPFDRLTDLIEHCSANPIDSAYNRLIPYGEFPTLKKLIAEDRLTHVYLGAWRTKEVVVKHLKPKSPVSTLLQDIQYLKRIHHPVCVRTLEITYQWTSVNSTMIMIIMEPFEGITLKKFFSSADSYFLKFDDLLKMYTEISEGMEYLECHGIVHSDLNDKHILRDSRGQVQIIDIGIRSLLAKSNEFSPDWYPFDAWSAPEFAEDPKDFTHYSDVWAFGILGFVVFTKGEEPYKDVPPDTLSKFIQNGNHPNSSRKEFTDILPVLKFCWQICPEERQTFAQITKWLKNGDFQQYANFAVNSKIFD